MKPDIILYTDGSCPRNGEPDAAGGWGFVILDNDGRSVEGKSQTPVPTTTSNRMELTAVIEGLRTVTEVYGEGKYIQVWTDSKVTIGVLSGHFFAQKNLDLIDMARVWMSKHKRVIFVHVPGHDGHAMNERADELAGFATVSERGIPRRKKKGV